MTITQIFQDKTDVTRTILKGLPQWFGIPEAIEKYAAEAEHLPMFGKVIGNSCAGFLTLKSSHPGVAEIHVVGVRPEWRRRGIGTELIDAAIDFERERGTALLTVKTLGVSENDPFYAETRAFYEAMGFLAVEEVPNYWNGTHAMLLMAKPL